MEKQFNYFKWLDNGNGNALRFERIPIVVMVMQLIVKKTPYPSLFPGFLAALRSSHSQGCRHRWACERAAVCSGTAALCVTSLCTSFWCGAAPWAGGLWPLCGTRPPTRPRTAGRVTVAPVGAVAATWSWRGSECSGCFWWCHSKWSGTRWFRLSQWSRPRQTQLALFAWPKAWSLPFLPLQCLLPCSPPEMGNCYSKKIQLPNTLPIEVIGLKKPIFNY